ncbi:hypothetical protein K490DRAFT_59060 [Saccharata proteae CBS 121410]|uniref:Uncharacterized protein n=1 Tax=Saccharata proteae CBS 121410 TaxID=1314787 RepID=A0A9P4LUJ5_9PEZI|nr:hypothetical protein K490DRAFT_59060 [Saccharata proteae CBS 121410]
MTSQAYHSSQDAQSDSGISNLEYLDSDTDEFGRQMIQQAKDKQRMTDALRANTQPFRRARTHPRVGLTLDKLERNNAINEHGNEIAAGGGGRQYDSPASVSSGDGSDQPVRLPREWGRKGRRDRGWLRRITSPELNTEGRSQADDPITSVEATPATIRQLAQDTPSRKSSASFDDWDLADDLTMGSIIASTPAVPRNTILDDIRQRELDSIKERGVTTNRLDRIRETSPEEARRRSGSSTSYTSYTESAEPKLRERSGSDMNLPKQQRPDRLRTKSSASSINYLGHGEGMPGSPFTVYKSPPIGGIVDHEIQANAQAQARPQGSRHQRDHSQDLLRRLARASSNSPSPGKNSEKGSSSNKQQQNSPLADREKEQHAGVDKTGAERRVHDRRQSIPSGQGMPTPPPEGNDGFGKDTLPNARTHAQPVQPVTGRQPRRQEDFPPLQTPTAPKTPHVTGGWIETPAAEQENRHFPDPDRTPILSPRSSSRTRDSQSEEDQMRYSSDRQPSGERRVSKPNLPKSAVDGILNKPGGNKDAYGDTTLQSIRGLLTGDEKRDTEPTVEDDTMDSVQVPDEHPNMTEAELKRRDEALQLKDMNKTLRSYKANVRDADRHADGLQDRVDKMASTPTTPGAGQQEQAHKHSVHCLCDRLLVRFKHLFYNPYRTSAAPTTASTTRFTIFYSRLTWLGLFFLVLFSWYLAETLLCSSGLATTALALPFLRALALLPASH